MPTSRRQLKIPITALHRTSTRPISWKSPLTFEISKMVCQLYSSKWQPSRKGFWISPMNLFQWAGPVDTYLIETTIQDQRCSALIPEGPPYLLLLRWRNAHTTSSSLGAESSTGKGVNAGILLYVSIHNLSLTELTMMYYWSGVWRTQI